MAAKKENRRRQEVIGLFLIILAVLVIIAFSGYDYNEEPSNITHMRPKNNLGIGGVFIAYYLMKMFLGLPSAVIPLLLFLWGWWILAGKDYATMTRLSLFAFMIALLSATSLALSHGSSWEISGLVGGLFADFLRTFLGTVGTWLFIGASFLVIITGYFGWSLYDLAYTLYSPLSSGVRSAGSLIGSLRSKSDNRRKQKHLLKSAVKASTEDKPVKKTSSLPQEDEKKERIPPKIVDETKPLPVEKSGKDEMPADDKQNAADFDVREEIIEKEADLDAEQPAAGRREYAYPSVDLLETPVKVAGEGTTQEEIMENARLLEDTLESFGVRAKTVEVHPGPVITRFELEPAAGVKISKIVSLADDLALALRAKRVRILAPIPGKAAVGVEIPNAHPSIVYLRTIMNSEKFINSDSPLTIALGKTAAGEVICVNLSEMPHLLLAGSTGSGKSVCINTIITSILYKAKPEDVRFILIDPKKLELSIYKKLAGYHLMPLRDVRDKVITDPHTAVVALKSAEVEMERRYDLLAEAVVRSIHEYNEKARAAEDMEILPYIVVIIDELADLMITAAKEIEEPIARLTQMARAVGIHMIVATQRPSVDVLTGVIKANFPARIAFQVATKIDSRTILDVNGAEKLLGKGDMLYMPPAQPETIRAHNSFVTLKEIERVLQHIREQPKYVQESLPSVKELPPIPEEGGYISTYGRDSLFREALRLVVTHQQGSVSLLQRRLRVGYSRAARLIDELEQAGVVGPFEGSKAREVLWTDDDMKKNLEGDDEES